MNLRRAREDDVEINLTSLIDVVLLLLVFFMVSTTFVTEAEIRITLPEATADAPQEHIERIEVVVDAEGSYFIDGRALINRKLETLREGLSAAAGDMADPIIVINADASAAHQAVIDVLDAARQLGFLHITFATELRAPQ